MIRNAIYLVTISVLLLACEPAKGRSEEITVAEYIVGGEKLYIPDAYTKFGHTSVGRESGLLQAFYPGSNPVPGDPQELWGQGEWYKNVRILFTKQNTPFSPEFLKSRIDFTRSHKNLGEEYGLISLTQDENEDASRDDIWIEDEQLGHFISCTGKRDANDEVQLCTHYFKHGHYRINITFNKRLLSEWKIIKANAIELLESFKSREAATAYVQKFYNENNVEGDKP